MTYCLAIVRINSKSQFNLIKTDFTLTVLRHTSFKAITIVFSLLKITLIIISSNNLGLKEKKT